ncbi:tyrosinase family protein [Kitasatospora gansuensis]
MDGRPGAAGHHRSVRLRRRRSGQLPGPNRDHPERHAAAGRTGPAPGVRTAHRLAHPAHRRRPGPRLRHQAAPGRDPDLATYDFTPWNAGSRGFRNQLEGFRGPGLHNQVHRWVGGDMGPASSPNDPVFFLHHCNVDRIWEGWMHRHGRSYLPGMNASPTLRGHRIDDPIVSPLGPAATPAARWTRPPSTATTSSLTGRHSSSSSRKVPYSGLPARW